MKKPVIPIVIAVVLAIGAAACVYAFARTSDAHAVADQQPVSVLVSTDVIPSGTTLQAAVDAGLIEQTFVPSRLSPPLAVSEISGANAGLIATADVPAGQLILDGAFAADTPDVVPIDVPDGMMAVSVLLEAPAKVGPFLRPGSSIAVFDTASLGSPGAGGGEVMATQVILDQVTVLAIGPVTQRDESSAAASAWDQTLVTVAVDQAQAQALVHGAQTGALYLGLLGDGAQASRGTGITNSTLFRSAAPSPGS